MLYLIFLYILILFPFAFLTGFLQLRTQTRQPGHVLQGILIEGMVIKPGKHHRSKQRCQDLCSRSTCTIFCFALNTLCTSSVIKTFLLASSSVSSKQLLCFVKGQGQKSEQKHTTKNFFEFHNLFPSP